jgi:PAS domain S-box-containing protein
MTTFMGRTGSVNGIASNRPNFTVLDTEQQLRVFKALSSIIDFAYTFDSHCRFLYANQALLDLLGLPLNEIVGKTFQELPYPYELAVRLESQIRQVFETGKKLVDETTYTNPAGMTGYYEYIFNPVFGDDGEVEIVAGSTREVTHRKLNEQMQGQLAAIVDSSDDAIVSKDLNGIVASWNCAAERFFGYTAAEMVGTSILRIIPVDLHHEESLILAKIRNGERIDHYETTRLRKNGETIEVSLTVSPIRNSAGVVVGTSKIARDISGRKQMERLLMQAEKIATMGRMAATIAHEVNNPLESITNLIYLARARTVDNPEVMEYLNTAEREVERVSHITRQTLGYFRDTTAHGDVSCHTLIKEVLRVYYSKIEARNIVVDTVFDTVRPVHASKGELMQILSNLIANSIDAMPTGGRLHVRVSEQDAAHIKITVEDEGIGIAPENLPRVFEPFFTTKGNLGTGIGLWVSKKLIEKHHGEISICSRDAQYRGTCICMSLPFGDGSSAM